MSVEKETRRALRWMGFWRIVVSGISVFEDLFGVLSNLMLVGREFFRQLSKTAYTFEQEHARRYFALTGLDPARADGDEERYQEIRITAGVEERPSFGFDEDEDDKD